MYLGLEPRTCSCHSAAQHCTAFPGKQVGLSNEAQWTRRINSLTGKENHQRPFNRETLPTPSLEPGACSESCPCGCFSQSEVSYEQWPAFPGSSMGMVPQPSSPCLGGGMIPSVPRPGPHVNSAHATQFCFKSDQPHLHAPDLGNSIQPFA